MSEIELDTIGEETILLGEYLKREMLRQGIKKSTLAKKLGIHRQSLYNVLSGKRKISYNMARRLEEVFEETVDFWLAKTVTVPKGKFSYSQTPSSKEKLIEAESKKAPENSFGTNHSPRILVDHEIKQAIQLEGLGIEPFNHKMVSSASLDLTIGNLGDTPFSELFNEGHDVSKNVVLNANHGVNVVTRERLDFPKNFLARIGAIAANAKKGLLAIHGFQVDPGYRGTLSFRVVNLGPKEIELKTGTPILSLELVKLSTAPDKAHNADKTRRSQRIGEELEGLLAENLQASEKPSGEWRCDWPAAIIETEGESGDVATGRALNIVYDIMQGENHSGSYNVNVVRDTLEKSYRNVPLMREDVEDLIQKTNIASLDKYEAAIAPLNNKGIETQSLYVTCERLGLDAHKVALAYIKALSNNA